LRSIRGGVEGESAQHKGFDNHEMVDAIHDGKLNRVPHREEMPCDSNANHGCGSILQARFLRPCRIIFSAHRRFADVRPARRPVWEKEGTFTSTERRISG